jgi:hypothetical protein
MESQTSSVIHAYTPGAGGVRAKVERGQRGGYAWELSVEVPAREGEDHRAAFERAIDALVLADRTMDTLFGVPPRDEPRAA